MSENERAFVASVEDEMKLRGCSPRTRKSYRNRLLRFKRHVNQKLSIYSGTALICAMSRSYWGIAVPRRL